jgi:hypothetical protein
MAGTTTKKVIIWVIIILFLVSSGLTFVLYLISPSQTSVEENAPVDLQEYVDVDSVNVVVPSNESINVDTPEDNDIQLIVSEDEDKDEENTTLTVPLGNGEVDNPTQSDFTDTLQLAN